MFLSKTFKSIACHKRLLTWRRMALVCRISLVTLKTGARGRLVDHVAHSVDAASIFVAWVPALGFYAGLFTAAVGVRHALWSACGVGVAKEALKALACAGPSLVPAEGVATAGVRVAGRCLFDDGFNVEAAAVRVARVTRVALAFGLMTLHEA
jgi:hypothetical protein